MYLKFRKNKLLRHPFRLQHMDKSKQILMLRKGRKYLMEKTGRIHYIDYLRGICMLWIVGVLHMADIIQLDIIQHPIAKHITGGALAVFTLVSGYFMGHYPVNSKADILYFFRRRFLRIYPLFILACIWSWIICLRGGSFGLIFSVRQLLCTLLGVSWIIPPIPYTFWYMSVLIAFYAITPFINMIHSYKYKIFAMSLLFGFLCFLNYVNPNFDHRVLEYIPFYFIGLLLAPNNLMERVKYVSRKILVPVMLGSILLYIAAAYINFENLQYPSVFMFISSAAFTAGLCGIFIMLEPWIIRSVMLDGTLRFLGKISFSVYLIHRNIFSFYVDHIHIMTIPAVYLLLLPSIFLVSYLLQTLCDKLVSLIPYPQKSIK